MFLGILVLLTALSISAVAIYYSVAGLVAIFAAAAVPIIIMGTTLEIGKLVTAVWLHRYWNKARWWLKYYLALAVVVLMFITSMGIFGFLSKAHIEQTSASIESVEQVARIETELARQQAIIDRAEVKINEAENSTSNRNDDINAQIEKEQQRIDNAYERIKPAIEEQQKIIEDARLSDADRTKPYEDQLSNIKDELVRLENSAKEYETTIAQLDVDTSAIIPIQEQIATLKGAIAKVEGQIASGESEQIKQAQLTIGSNADGQAGPNTRRSANTWIGLQNERITELQEQISQLRIEAKETVDNERERLSNIVSNIRDKQIPALKDREVDMLSKIDSVRATESPIVATARDEIARIRSSADEQVKASQTLIQQLREKIKVDGGVDVDAIVDEQTLRIQKANKLIDELTEEKYTIEAEYRKLEAEVGPIKYLAEFVYGETNQDILEEAVRWVIVTIIFVFDPLAVLLLIASQATLDMRRKEQSMLVNEDTNNDNTITNNIDDEYAQPSEEERSVDSESEQTTKEGTSDEDAGLHNSAGTGSQGGSDASGGDDGRDQASIDDQTPNPYARNFTQEETEQDNVQEDVEPEEHKERREKIEKKEKEDDAYKEAKRQYKEDHPNQNLKFWKDQYIQGKVENVPWDITYIARDESGKQFTGYIQNSEQDENSLWQKIGSDDKN